MKDVNLNFFSVAIMYVGTIMGAGFASGREIWQFFGVFGEKAYIGVIFVGVLFMVMGMMTSFIARELNTNDMGKVIVPGNNQKIVDLVGYFMAFMLFTVLITMSAAGGSIFYQQFGQSKILGGMIIIILVIITVLGEFQRVSKVFRFIMPVLFIIVIGVSILVIFKDIGDSGYNDPIKPSPMAKTWWLAAMLYISYNILALIPIVATASVNAKDEKSAVIGTGLGGMLLGLLAFVLVCALQTDMSFSQALDMPMLGYSGRISKIVNIIYTVVLMIAVYSSATSNYYGFTTKIKDSPKKKYIIITVAWVGFFCGLIGFKKVVAYMFPAEGFLGFIIIAMIITNFVIVYRKKQQIKNALNNRFSFPDGCIRVTAGKGGESILIVGKEKVALYDCGMAYCNKDLIKNIEKELYKRNLKEIDYILLSHSHYDHVGALPYLLKRWSKAQVIGSEKCKNVFKSSGARKTMKELGEVALASFSSEKTEIIVDGLRVDRVVCNNDSIDLGDKVIKVLETKGHTDCSLTYVIDPDKIMLASESTGVLRSNGVITTAILKDYDMTIESAKRAMAYNADYLVIPHYGILDKENSIHYFHGYIKAAEEEKEFILNCKNKGMSFDEILLEHEKKYWSSERAEAQPKEAYITNAEYTIKHILDSYFIESN